MKHVQDLTDSRRVGTVPVSVERKLENLMERAQGRVLLSQTFAVKLRHDVFGAAPG
mgnify:CR=1 FL=1